MDDLAALLGYEGARVEGEAEEVASDILRVPFWSVEFCRLVICAAEATGGFAPQDDDPVPGHEISLAAIAPRLYEHLENDIGARLWPRLRQWWPCVDYHGLRDAFVIKYALGAQESLRIHHDVAQVSASIRLNDDYLGGQLEFPRQGFDNTGVGVGDALVWPSLVTHPHRSAALRTGVKYSLTIWCELPLV